MTKQEAIEYAKKHNLNLSENADNIIRAIENNNGCCPCKRTNEKCPCSNNLKEIKEKGHCCCNLFLK